MNTVAARAPSGWSQAFEIERVYNDRQAKPEQKNIQIRVMCGESVPTMLTRKHRQWMHTIQMAVRKTVDPANISAIDALGDFAESVAEYWSAGEDAGKRVVSGTFATVSNVSYIPYAPDVLDTDRIFLSIITLNVLEAVPVNPPSSLWTSGVVSGGSGTVNITSGVATAGTVSAFTYYTHGGTSGTETVCAVNYNGVTAANLDGKYSEIGVGIRCASSGVGLRNGYYCVLRVSYSGSTQTAQIRIYENSTLRATATLAEIGLSTTYALVVQDTGASITAILLNSARTVVLGTAAYNTTTYASNTRGAYIFDHHSTLTRYTLPSVSSVDVRGPFA